MEQNNGLAALYAALAKAQGAFQPITKNRDGQDGNRTFKYADLDELIQKTRPALVANELCIFQQIGVNADGQHMLTTTLAHSSGAVLSAQIRLSSFDNVKHFGASITYLRRYAYQSILCISADDDLDDNPEGAPKAPADPGKQAKKPEQLEPAFYDQKAFEQNLPNWTTAINKGQTTAERVIKKIETKARLTDEQRKTIQSIEVKQA